MRLFTIIAFTLTLAIPAFAGPVEDVANAERAFAKAFADRDQAKFFAMVAPDANFLGFRTLRGKDAVVKGWSRLFEGPAPFSWGPERVEVTADGKLGLSTGPIYDTSGKHTGDYSSIWQKQSDGSWKVIFDGPGSAPVEVGKIEEGWVDAGDGTKLHYRKFGGGPVTLIVPLDNDLSEHFQQFANIATVITYDHRARTMEQDVEDLETIRRELKVEKFVPVGISDLGLLVALYTLDHPDRVTRVVQIAPGSPRELTPEKLQAIKVPVLTIHGDMNRGAEWAKALPDARLITVKGAAWLDDPVTVFASIRHFLRGEWPIGSATQNR
jgi:ketosteroid isomerase-like protein